MHGTLFARSLVLCLALPAASAHAQHAFSPFEGPQTHPIAVSPDGSRLAAVEGSDQRVAIYSLHEPSRPVLLGEIPVGLEPVSLRFRDDDELWCVNWLSDSVSVISLSQWAVVATVQVPDEPADVVFAGQPERAFVSATARDVIFAIDVSRRTLIGTLTFPSKDPRALATNAARDRLYALSSRSGNQTTIVPTPLAPPPPPPTNAALPLAPRQGLIVHCEDQVWRSVVNTVLPDEDLIEFDPQTFAILRRVSGIGTTNFDLAVHPSSGDVFVVNTSALNLLRFEPVLRARSIFSRVTRIEPGGQKHYLDLNPSVSYTTIPDPAGAALALSEPTGIALDAARDLVFVAAQGTDRIGVLSPSGAILARIELGQAGATSNARTKKGPRGLVLHPTAPVLYVHQRLAGSIAVIDTRSFAVLREMPFPFDPMPASWKAGRGFLYDAKLSGNGTMSCAACHVDADMDGLAWDLGDPGGVLEVPPSGQVPPFQNALLPFHPMKGPMVTQTLRGLRGERPFHWRGDRPDLEAFNGAFDSLMGGTPLSSVDMADFKAFLMEIPFPPNPNQLRNRSFSSSPAVANAAAGDAAFRNFTVLGGAFFPSISCTACHALPSGSNRQVLSLTVGNNQAELQMKIPQLRNLYRRVGFRRGGPSKAGFGFTHNGAVESLAQFLATPPFVSWPANVKAHIEQFLLAFDTGTAPAVGFQRQVDASNATSLAVLGDLGLLEAEAARGNCDLVARGRWNGEDFGFCYDPALQRYLASRAALGSFSRSELLGEAQSGRATFVFTGVPPSAGRRMGLDRDADGTLDGDEGVVPYGSSTGGCGPLLRTNGPARLGDLGFALVLEGAPGLVPGALLLGLGRTSVPVLGFELLVDPLAALFVSVPLQVDARGEAAFPFPLLRNSTLVGARVTAQAVVPSTCGPQGFAASQGLELTLQR